MVGKAGVVWFTRVVGVCDFTFGYQASNGTMEKLLGSRVAGEGRHHTPHQAGKHPNTRNANKKTINEHRINEYHSDRIR